MSQSKSFHNLETLGGILLFTAAVIAILIANSPFRILYEHALQVKGTIGSVANKDPLKKS